MAANCGVDFEEFCQLLLCVTELELELLQTSPKSKWRCIFNLHRIRNAFEHLLPQLPSGDSEAARDPNTGNGSVDGTPSTEFGLADLAIIRNQPFFVRRNIVILLNILQSAISGGMSRLEGEGLERI
jgi:hypothetical protein